MAHTESFKLCVLAIHQSVVRCVHTLLGMAVLVTAEKGNQLSSS